MRSSCEVETELPRHPRDRGGESRGPAESLDGVVKWYDPARGFGFVVANDGGKDIFVHVTALRRSGIEMPAPPQRMLDLTVEYVGERVQFGVPVGSFQAVKHAAAEMVVSIEGTRAAVHYAAWAVGAGEPGAALDAWVAKARSARIRAGASGVSDFFH